MSRPLYGTGVSRDGTCRLWDCGTQKQLAVVMDIGTAINQSALASGSMGSSVDGSVERSVPRRKEFRRRKAVVIDIISR